MNHHPIATPPRPFTRSYWVVPGRLLAGFLPADRDPSLTRHKLEALRACGVTHIFNLMESDETDHAGRLFEDYTRTLAALDHSGRPAVICQRRPIRDLGTPTEAHMSALLDEIDAALAGGGTVYVHCWGGRGRTGTVIGCWLARHGIANGPQALRKLSELTAHARRHFPIIPEMPGQRAFVKRWPEGR